MDTDKEGSKQIAISDLKNIMFNYYKNEMEVETEKFLEKNPEKIKVNLNVLQLLESKEEMKKQVLDIADFYNKNYIGNKDFIHIPNINNIMENATKYPIILAYKEDYICMDNILGVTTIKNEKNERITDNPYCPTIGENVLFITGILTKSDFGSKERIRGIGKLLFKTAIRGAYYINKKEKVRLICESDCRNQNSIRAISNAVKELQLENIPVQLMLNGYYEIINAENELKEAPTFLLEIDLTGNQKIDNKITTFPYSSCEEPQLLRKLSKVIQNNTENINQLVTQKNGVTIVYNKIKPINALNIRIDVGNSADGNKRIPTNSIYSKDIY